MLVKILIHPDGFIKPAVIDKTTLHEFYQPIVEFIKQNQGGLYTFEK